jgi:hypothetical protein
MILSLTTVHENARSALECGGSTPPYINLERDGQGGVKPLHSKVPSAQPFSWQRGISLWFGRIEGTSTAGFLISLGMTSLGTSQYDRFRVYTHDHRRGRQQTPSRMDAICAHFDFAGML